MAAQTISHYNILRKLGSGGMGDVYLAEDTRLGRKVALKFLPSEFAKDPERVARLEREARAASALNHPNILVIHDIGKSEDVYFMAAEFVDGQTLRDRLKHGRIQLIEGLDIATQVLTALSVAHEAGIMHRDIKPENIMLRPDGFVKVLDFGLAKVTKLQEFESRETPTVAATSPGMVLGTVAYMSPEQARGIVLDTRTDIFTAGIVLYEMINGRRPFEGQTSTDILLQILEKEPAPLSSQFGELTETLNWILGKALRKERDERYQTAKEFAADLKNIKQRLQFEAEMGRQSASSQRTARYKEAEAPKHRWPFSLLDAVGRRKRKDSHRSGPHIALPKLSQLTFADAIEQYPDWAPDGKQIVFCREISGMRKIFGKNAESSEEIQLTKGSHDEIQPAWSSDNQILFVRAHRSNSKLEPGDVFGIYDGGDVWGIDLQSGKEIRLLENAFNPSISPDGKQIAFDASWAGPRRIWISDSKGRNPLQITTDISEELTHVRPRWSPDGTKIVFQNIERTKFDIRVVDIKSRDIDWVTNDLFQDLNPVWSASGKFIYFSSYRSGGMNVWRIPVTINGLPAGPPQQLTAGAGQDVELSISRDGKRIGFSILKQNADIWKLPVDPHTGEPTGISQQVIATTREDSRGAWSPDGTQIAFNSDRTGQMNIWVHSRAAGSVKQLTKGAGGDFQPNWSPDGKMIAFFSSRAGTPDIWTVDCTTGRLQRLTRNDWMNINPFYSPDGKMIAYHSDQSGRPEVWLMNADGSGQHQLTEIGCGGHFLRWSHDSHSIIFRCPYGEKATVQAVPASGGEPQIFAEVAGGSHISFSPDFSLIMDVVVHKTLWVSHVQKGDPYPRKIFEFENPAARIDYPVWSPDGKWILFDLFQPQGGDIWMMEDFETFRS